MSRPSQDQTSEAVQQARETLVASGYGRFVAEIYRFFLADTLAELPDILHSFADLQADRHMGDGGTYRYRAYSRFRLEPAATPSDVRLSPLEGNSIYQELEDNPVNGGVLRTYDPLHPVVVKSSFLSRLILADYRQALDCGPELANQTLAVGVHQVRIVARGDTPGLPAPEGIHRDRERFTFQHFMARHNVNGGEFRAHDEEKRVTFAWLQEDCLDTVMFEGTTWHSATPITVSVPGVEGYRDIFLIDFDPLEA